MSEQETPQNESNRGFMNHNTPQEMLVVFQRDSLQECVQAETGKQEPRKGRLSLTAMHMSVFGSL